MVDSRIASLRHEIQILLDEQILQLKGDRSRRRGQMNRRIHELRHMLQQGYPYASQAGQDVVVDRIFKGKRNGTFVDIGGYDGVTGSNTLFLEQRRGWGGLLIEPVASHRARARHARRCITMGIAIGPKDGQAEFLEVVEGFTQMSGLMASYDPATLETIRRNPRHRERVGNVPVRSLSFVLQDAGIPNPDFISLDIEGGEVGVLAEFPFDAHQVGVWSIENNSGSSDIAQIMIAAGYDLVEFCGPDEIWRKRGL